MMIKALIFDFDGVILDSEPLHYEACCQVIQPLGITLGYDEYMRRYLGFSDKDMFPELMSNEGYNYSEEEIKKLIQQKVTAYTDIIASSDYLPLIADFEQFIFKIAAKINLRFAVAQLVKK